MSKEKFIPQLRFPEFDNEGEWEIKTIGEVFKSFSGGTPSTSESKYYNGKIPFIRSAEINKEKTELFITDEGLKSSSAKLVQKGDLLVALYGANSADTAISKIDGAINQAILCLQSESSNSFTYGFLTLKKEWIISRYIQGGQGNLSGDIVKSITIPFPTPQEQQKIASCLSCLDELLAAHKDKLDALKDHKKGLMQNLFPQEGETVPKVRFKEFEGDGEWLTYSLKDLTKINQGLQIPISKRLTEKEKNSYFYITNEFLKANSKRAYYILNPPENVICEKEDVLMTRTGNTGQVVTNAHGAFHNNFFKIQFDRKILNKDFLVYFLRLSNTQRIIMSYAGTSTIPDLNHSDFYRILMNIPAIQEQQKIASCLSALDDLITAQIEKIEQLQQHKKGLMQGLFPRIET